MNELESRALPSFTVAPNFFVGPNSGQGSKPVAIAVGDFNTDGKSDVVTANDDAHFVSVLLGNGDGTFQSSNDIDIGQSPVSVVEGDLNGDGKLDIATANQTDNSIAILLGNGDGTFQAATTVSTGASTGPASIAVGDLDGDGKADLAVADNGADTVTILTGDGNGGFTATGTTTVNANPTSVALVNLDNDGDLDIVTVSGGIGHLNVNLNNGNGTFATTVNYATGLVANTVVAGDFNEDGKPDVAVACGFTSSDGVSILLGKGDGTFFPFVDYSAGGQTPASIAIADLNGDGHQDLLTANGQLANNSVSYLPGTGTGTFGVARVFVAGQGPVAIAVGDFNGDGKQDLVTADSAGSSGTVSMLLGNGDGTVRAATDLVVSGPGPIVAADFNRDGKIDLAVITTGVSYSGVTLFTGTGAGSFNLGVQTAPISQPNGIAYGDFNADGKLDLVVTGSAGVSTLRGNGNGTFGAPSTHDIAPGASYVTALDYDNDGRVDLAVAVNTGSNGVFILPGDGSGIYLNSFSIFGGGAATYLTAGDLDSDGFPDLAVINGSADTVTTVLNTGGSFGAGSSYNTRTGPQSVSIADFNADGLNDLAVPTLSGPGTDSAFSVFNNNGDGTFSGSGEYVTGARPIGSSAFDMNGDGRIDLATVDNSADDVFAFKNDGAGGFGTPTAYVVGDRPTFVATADFNGDGRLDLAVVNSNSGSVTLLTTPKPAAQLTMSIVPSTAVAGDNVQVIVTAVDVNGDKVADFEGAVHFSSDDLTASLTPADYTFTEADAGQYTFNAILYKAGTRTLNVTSGSLSGSGTIDITSAPADHFQFDVPTQATAGDLLDLKVTVFDPYDNLATGYTGTVQFSTNDPHVAAFVPDDYTFTSGDAGVHSFLGAARLVTVGSHAIVANPAGLGPLSRSVNVSPAAAARVTIGAPGNATAGVPFNVSVTALDLYDNLATGFTGTVHLQSSDLSAVLPPDYPFVAGDLGAHALPVTLTMAGLQSISVSSSGLTGDQKSGIQVGASSATQLAFVSGPFDTLLSTPTLNPVKIQVQDMYGNSVAQMVNVTLVLAGNPGGPKTILKNANVTTDGAGLAVFPKLMLNKSGQGYSIVAQSTIGNSPVSSAFTVYTTTKLKMTLSTNKEVAGAPLTVTVAVLDKKNNIDPTYTGTVHFTSTALALANIPPDYTFLPADQGQHTFVVSVNKAGSQKLTVADMQKPKIKKTAAIVVSADVAKTLLVAGIPSPTKAGATRAFTVTALDAFGNRATTYLGTVHFHSSDATV
ncbi:MAG TPA: VCBS repeat-containing protein, partial [Gemmataceae bacterium]|nr:VCBS repeat-containing protein [Gemmataceae bacterium]